MITTCSTCLQPMDGSSCIDERAWPWGQEPGIHETPDWPCHDCGVEPGGNHHPGCAVAICKRHGDQLLGCDHAPAALLH